MREYFKKALHRLPLLFAALCAAALIVALPSVSAAGVKKGLLVCASSAVPSLYPFCVLSAFFVRSGLCGYLGKLLEKPVRILFNLPGSAGAAACMSFVAGYPVGAGMTAALFEQGRISQADAQRMTLFCVNAGPAFVIGGVGASRNFFVADSRKPHARLADKVYPPRKRHRVLRPRRRLLPALAGAARGRYRGDEKYDFNLRVDSHLFLRLGIYPPAAPSRLGGTAAELHARGHGRMRVGSRNIQSPRHSRRTRLGRSERTLPDNAAHKDLPNSAFLFLLRASRLRRPLGTFLRGSAARVPVSRQRRRGRLGRRAAAVLVFRACGCRHAFERSNADIGA